jgi:hypothetical protein
VFIFIILISLFSCSFFETPLASYVCLFVCLLIKFIFHSYTRKPLLLKQLTLKSSRFHPVPISAIFQA